MDCANCGAENRGGARFCRACGRPMPRSCPNGHPVAADDTFCDVCGASVEAAVDGIASSSETAADARPAERRLVSVLFADLVGFTPIAGERDPEEVREILSGYFDRMREIVERHGGVVEKFIGDAVMAVWGSPVAHEDDAERAVRAALAMTESVGRMSEQLDLADATLAVRVGILTGEAATSATGADGLVAGDLVNTAARIQSIAPPGTVLVGEGTRRATEAAIAYEDAGAHELKGKAAPVPVWRALRVIAGRGGSGKVAGLEAPFVGRDAELHLVQELFHGSARDGRGRLASVLGVAGIGKTRLSWELEKYVDGIVEDVWWHRGRCLPYGEGVTYWALAEMVRMRAGIAEEEEPLSARAKVAEAVAQHVPDPEEARWVEPRLAHLLGFEESGSDREELFSAWGLFLERLTDTLPTVLVVEDLQWGDAGVLDFIEYVLERLRARPFFVLTLARPDLLERRPSWGAGAGVATSIHLDPLPPDAMDELLSGLVPGLSPNARDRIRDRSEGVPLYAVETVRMLIDRGVLVAGDGGYRLAGEVGAIEVPETLHALIAARLDGLGPDERRALQDASVLGLAFTRDGLTALTDAEPEVLTETLASLVRRQFLAIESNPRSPERGQYTFLQALVREITYGTLARAERKARHLAVARYLEERWEEEEVVEVIASHYLDAYRAVPDAPDSESIKAAARQALVRAGRRAGSLGASEESARWFERAMELADDPALRASLAERTGVAVGDSGDLPRAVRVLEAAQATYEAEGLTHDAARVSAAMAEHLWSMGTLDEAIDRMETAYAVLSGQEEDADVAALAAELGRFHFFRGDLAAAAERVEDALRIGERRWLPSVLAEALNTKYLVLGATGRWEEGLALLRHALAIALEHELKHAGLRAYFNLANELSQRDRLPEAAELDRQGLALARRTGSRPMEWGFLAHLTHDFTQLGDWDAALAAGAEVPHPNDVPSTIWAYSSLRATLMAIHLERGEIAEVERLGTSFPAAADESDRQDQAARAVTRAILHRSRGQPAEALEEALTAVAAREALGTRHGWVQGGFVEALSAAAALGDGDRVAQLIGVIEGTGPGGVTPLLLGLADRYGGWLAAAGGQGDAGLRYAEGARAFREAGLRFFLGLTLADHGTWLRSRGEDDRATPLLDEAREIFEGLGATERLRALDRPAGADGPPEPISAGERPGP